MRAITKIVGTALGLAMAASANAGFVYTDAGGPDPIAVPANNNFQAQLGGEGVSSFNLGRVLGVTGPGVVDVIYRGKEAGYVNSFQFNGSTVATTSAGGLDPWQTTVIGTYAVSTGALNLGFCANSIGACLTNAQNDTTVLGSVQSIGMRISEDGNTAWLLWDDSGANQDDNHDDMIIQLRYRVPEPATLGLMGLGLLGAGVAARRRNKK